MKIVNYNYVDEYKERVGVIAQQVQRVNPQLAGKFVDTDGRGFLTVSFSELVFPLIAAVQKLSAEVKQLKEDKQ